MEAVSSWSEHAARHEAMCAKWGKPEPVDAAAALAAIGVHTRIGDVVAYRYSSREAAEAFAASNLENGGYASLGITETADGVIGVTCVPLHVR